MPPRERDGLFNRAERKLRDGLITFENGKLIKIHEPREMAIEVDEPDEMPIVSTSSLEATISLKVQLRILEAAFNRIVEGSRDAIDAISRAMKSSASACASSVDNLDGLNVWESFADDFEIADEEEYIATDTISFDELMGGVSDDN